MQANQKRNQKEPFTSTLPSRPKEEPEGAFHKYTISAKHEEKITQEIRSWCSRYKTLMTMSKYHQISPIGSTSPPPSALQHAQAQHICNHTTVSVRPYAPTNQPKSTLARKHKIRCRSWQTLHSLNQTQFLPLRHTRGIKVSLPQRNCKKYATKPAHT